MIGVIILHVSANNWYGYLCGNEPLDSFYNI